MDSLKIIKTEEEYEAALKKLAQLMDKNLVYGNHNFNHLEVLALIIEDYENKHCRIDKPSPEIAIKFRMEQMNLMKVEWFDINEQVPPAYTQVLFKCKGSKRMEVGMFLGEEFVNIMKTSAAPHPILNKSEEVYGEYGRYCTPAEHDTVVTHWMVLPEPPNEEEQGETKC